MNSTRPLVCTRRFLFLYLIHKIWYRRSRKKRYGRWDELVLRFVFLELLDDGVVVSFGGGGETLTALAGVCLIGVMLLLTEVLCGGEAIRHGCKGNMSSARNTLVRNASKSSGGVSSSLVMAAWVVAQLPTTAPNVDSTRVSFSWPFAVKDMLSLSLFLFLFQPWWVSQYSK